MNQQLAASSCTVQAPACWAHLLHAACDSGEMLNLCVYNPRLMHVQNAVELRNANAKKEWSSWGREGFHTCNLSGCERRQVGSVCAMEARQVSRRTFSAGISDKDGEWASQQKTRMQWHPQATNVCMCERGRALAKQVEGLGLGISTSERVGGVRGRLVRSAAQPTAKRWEQQPSAAGGS